MMEISKIYNIMKKYLGSDCAEKITVNVAGDKIYVSNGVAGDFVNDNFLIDKNGDIKWIDIFDTGNSLMDAEENGIEIKTYVVTADNVETCIR